ncbi:MAG: aldo/keto reductase [Actinobacteria bacterium]|nr:aldo/keto reductase [Actinomycetota bacterium]
MIIIPQTTLSVFPLCLGGNVFGWTIDEKQSHAVLNAYFEHGGNFVDTADVYSEWQDGNVGGESETIIGDWIKSRHNRDQFIVATKVAKLSTRPGLSAKNILAACDDSLKRLKTDYIDLYYSHDDDPNTPLQESLTAFSTLIEQGKVRYIASSNYSPERMTEALEVSKEHGLASYIGVQNQYNLLDRKPYEDGMSDVVAANNLSCLPYLAIARGFLTGKYQPGVTVDSVRAASAVTYQNERGWKTLSLVTDIAKSHGVPLAAVALAWLRSQSTVSVPISAARTVEQLEEIIQMVELSSDEIAELTDITA